MDSGQVREMVAHIELRQSAAAPSAPQPGLSGPDNAALPGTAVSDPQASAKTSRESQAMGHKMDSAVGSAPPNSSCMALGVRMAPRANMTQLAPATMLPPPVPAELPRDSQLLVRNTFIEVASSNEKWVEDAKPRSCSAPPVLAEPFQDHSAQRQNSPVCSAKSMRVQSGSILQTLGLIPTRLGSCLPTPAFPRLPPEPATASNTAARSKSGGALGPVPTQLGLQLSTWAAPSHLPEPAAASKPAARSKSGGPLGPIPTQLGLQLSAQAAPSHPPQPATDSKLALRSKSGGSASKLMTRSTSVVAYSFCSGGDPLQSSAPTFAQPPATGRTHSQKPRSRLPMSSNQRGAASSQRRGKQT